MNRQDRAKLLVDSINEATRRAEQERADKQQVERIAQAVKAKLARIHASDDDLVCPSCGYKGPESDFEPDTDDESDGYSTDDATSETGDDDDVEELDPKGKSRVVAELLARKRRVHISQRKVPTSLNGRFLQSSRSDFPRAIADQIE